MVSSSAESLPWIADLDAYEEARAIACLAPLFEGAPRFLRRLVAERPFWSWDRLFDRAREVAHGMPQAEQIEVLDAHPRLGAPAATLSASSSREQGQGDERGGGNRKARAGAEAALVELTRLNGAYEARFGFRYCVFVAGRPLAQLLPAFRVALVGERDPELRRGLDAVVDIAAARQRALAGPEAGR